MSTILNSSQKQVTVSKESVLIINAGPGTGKTKTLIARITHLIQEKKQNPGSILCLTFTNKAAREMRERLEAELKPGLGKKNLGRIFLGTFHSFGLEILKQYSKFSKDNLIDEHKRLNIIKNLLITYDKKDPIRVFTIREVSLALSNIKNSQKNLKNEQEVFYELSQKYEKKLDEEGKLDYDDLIVKSLKLIRNSDLIRKQLQSRYKYILVDEFQDTNESQYRIIHELVQNQENSSLFLIGDPLQSIYAFRGAKGDIFDQVKKDFPKSAEITLIKNYRSSKEIIEAAHKLFPESPNLEASSKEQGHVVLLKTMNEYTEADWILVKIAQTMGGLDLNQVDGRDDEEKIDKKADFSDFAVIYRTHGLSRILEKKFRESAIPFQIVGSASIFERPEIEILINTLEFLGEKSKENYEKLVNSKYSKASKSFIDKYIKEYEDTKDIGKTTDKIIKLYEIEKYLEEKIERLNDLYMFRSELIRFNKFDNPLIEFTKYITEIQENGYYDEKSDKVTLLTMHASKGLEFKYVFICGFEEGLIPFSKKAKSEDEIEEEKRLLYVAMTRAKRGLFLISARERNRKSGVRSSRFESLLRGENGENGEQEFTDLEIIEDNAIQKVQKKREIRKAKKAQIKMF